LYIRVQGADATPLGTGRYVLTLNFGSGPSPSVPTPATQTANSGAPHAGGGVAEKTLLGPLLGIRPLLGLRGAHRAFAPLDAGSAADEAAVPSPRSVVVAAVAPPPAAPAAPVGPTAPPATLPLLPVAALPGAAAPLETGRQAAGPSAASPGVLHAVAVPLPM